MKKVVVIKWVLGDSYHPSPDTEVRKYKWKVPYWAEELPETSKQKGVLTQAECARQDLAKEAYAIGILRITCVGVDVVWEKR